jgi:hypothetical protein
MEDLNVSGMVKNHKLAEAIMEVSWSRFKEILIYKAKWYNRNVISVADILINKHFAQHKATYELRHYKFALQPLCFIAFVIFQLVIIHFY